MNHIKKYMGTSLKNILTDLDFNCLSIFEKTTENVEDPSNSISKTMDMRPISIKKHEWMFAKMVPISSTKHKMVVV